MNTNAEDRDINQKLHEAMGRGCLHKFRSPSPGEAGLYELACERCGKDIECVPRGGAFVSRGCRRYDSSLTDAFDLVEWMRKERQLYMDICSDEKGWHVRFVSYPKTRTYNPLTSDESLPRAIALAAIRALEVK